MAEFERNAAPIAFCATAVLMVYPTMEAHDWWGAVGCVLFAVFTVVEFFRRNKWGRHRFLAGIYALVCAYCLWRATSLNFAPLTLFALFAGIAYLISAIGGQFTRADDEGDV